MELSAEQRGDVTVVSVKGRLDPITGPEFENFFLERIEGGGLKYVADMGGLEYISSAGLRSILVMGKKLKPLGGSIALANLQGMVKDVFEISGFASIFGIYETVDEACSSF